MYNDHGPHCQNIYLFVFRTTPANMLYRPDVVPIYISTSGRHRLSHRTDLGSATQLDVGLTSAAYQTTIPVRCRAALNLFYISPTSAFYLGPISFGDILSTFPKAPYSPNWTFFLHIQICQTKVTLNNFSVWSLHSKLNNFPKIKLI